MPADTHGSVDLDLHGLVGLRLLAPSGSDVAAVVRQLGLAPGRLDREPDLVLRFVDDLPRDGVRRPLGAGRFAHDDGGLLVSAPGGPGRRTARLVVDGLGRPGAEVVCDRRPGPVPLLVDLVNLAAVGHGVLPLHASAFVVDGTGVLVTGWAKGGKTEMLLGFAAQGAQQVGDEWVYLPGDRRMLGIPEPVRVWDWHLTDLPALRRRLPRRDRARLLALRGAEQVLRTAARGGGVLQRTADAVGRQRFVHLRPDELFGRRRTEGQLDVLLLTACHELPGTTVRPVAGADVARRMAASLQLERSRLWEAYAHSLFAFPDRRCTALEQAGAREAELLQRVLADVPAHEVRHPYPVDVPATVAAVQEVLADRPART